VMLRSGPRIFHNSLGAGDFWHLRLLAFHLL
jgi:hypothetical protein